MNIDRALFHWINVSLGHEALAPFMRVMSDLDKFLPVIVLLVLWLLTRGGKRGRITVLVLPFLILATDQTSSHLLKPLVSRPRPCRPEAGIPDVRTHGVGCSSRGSFPSSHAANMAATAVFLAGRFPTWAVPAGLIAFLVGYSRVYLGVHYPFDVLGGWALGAFLGWGALVLARRLDRLRRGPPPVRVDVEDSSP